MSNIGITYYVRIGSIYENGKSEMQSERLASEENRVGLGDRKQVHKYSEYVKWRMIVLQS